MGYFHPGLFCWCCARYWAKNQEEFDTTDIPLDKQDVEGEFARHASLVPPPAGGHVEGVHTFRIGFKRINFPTFNVRFSSF